MSEINLLRSHKWIQNQIRIGDRIFFHRQCQVCGRDLAMLVDEGEWRAVHIGAIDFDFLDDETTKRWNWEECPGIELPQDANHQRMLQRF